MKCLILAAGYATRLYPLTKNFPKPLLHVGEKTIVDWLIDDVEKRANVDEYIIVTNHCFIEAFQEWKRNNILSDKISIVDDGSTTNENRLGAVKDIAFALDSLSIDDDLLVLAGDNLLDFSLAYFVKYFYEKGHTCVMRHFEEDMSRLSKTGVASVDETGCIIEMEEKPKKPKSNWAVPPFYIYSREDLKLIKEGIESNCDTDAPGSFIAWLCGMCKVYAYEMPGKRYDIGNLESYQWAQDNYKGIIVG